MEKIPSCKSCKEKRPMFMDYLKQMLKFGKDNNTWEYIYCSRCGQYYYREAHSNNKQLLWGAFLSGVIVNLLLVYDRIQQKWLEYLLMGIVFVGVFFGENYLRYKFTKFIKVNIKVSKKDLETKGKISDKYILK